MDNFFRYVSRAVIITPIVIVVLSLIFKFNQGSSVKNRNLMLSPQIISPTIINKLGINLNEKWLCYYKIDNQEYLLKIDNKKIDLEATVSGQFRMYNLTPYSSIIESMLNMDLNQLESTVKPYLPNGINFKSLIKSCKKL